MVKVVLRPREPSATVADEGSYCDAPCGCRAGARSSPATGQPRAEFWFDSSKCRYFNFPGPREMDMMPPGMAEPPRGPLERLFGEPGPDVGQGSLKMGIYLKQEVADRVRQEAAALGQPVGVVIRKAVERAFPGVAVEPPVLEEGRGEHIGRRKYRKKR